MKKIGIKTNIMSFFKKPAFCLFLFSLAVIFVLPLSFVNAQQTVAQCEAGCFSRYPAGGSQEQVNCRNACHRDPDNVVVLPELFVTPTPDPHARVNISPSKPGGSATAKGDAAIEVTKSTSEITGNTNNSVGSGSIVWQWVREAVASLFVFFLVPIVAFLFHVVGIVFGWAVELSINTDFIIASSPTINLGWTIVRDFCNMLFIFLLIYISISIILDRNTHNVKQMLIRVIIAAILINFSLYFTKAIVDVGNIFGNWMYNNTKSVLARGQDTDSNLALLIIKNMRVYDITSTFSGGNSSLTEQQAAESLLNPTKTVLESVGKILFLLMGMFVFTYAAVLFLSRVIVILLLLMFSPIMFFGGIPKIQDYTKQWWDALWGAVTFPILFLLLMYITASFVANLSSITINGGSPPLVGGFNTNVILQYILLIGLLMATLKVAKETSNKMGGVFGSIAGSVAGFVTGAVVGAGTKGISMIGQRTFGAAGHGLATSENVKEWSKSSNFFVRAAGKGFKGVGKNVSEKTFDVGKGATKGLQSIGIKEIKAPKWTQASTKKGESGYAGMQTQKKKSYKEDLVEIGPKKEQVKLIKEEKDKAEKMIVPELEETTKVGQDKVASEKRVRELNGEVETLRKDNANKEAKAKSTNHPRDIDDAEKSKKVLSDTKATLEAEKTKLGGLEAEFKKTLDTEREKVYENIIARARKENDAINKAFGAQDKANEYIDKIVENNSVLGRIAQSLGGNSTVLAGLYGAALGSVVGGPLGMAAGATAGVSGRAVHRKNHKMAEELRKLVGSGELQEEMKKEKERKKNIAIFKEEFKEEFKEDTKGGGAPKPTPSESVDDKPEPPKP